MRLPIGFIGILLIFCCFAISTSESKKVADSSKFSIGLNEKLENSKVKKDDSKGQLKKSNDDTSNDLKQFQKTLEIFEILSNTTSEPTTANNNTSNNTKIPTIPSNDISNNTKDHLPKWLRTTVAITALSADGLTVLGAAFVIFSRIKQKQEDPFTALVIGVASGDLLVALNGIGEFLLAIFVSRESANEPEVWSIVTLLQAGGIYGATVAIIYSVFLALQAVFEAKKLHMWRYHLFAWLPAAIVYLFIYAFNWTNQLSCIQLMGTHVIWLGGCAPGTPFFAFAVVFVVAFLTNLIVSMMIIIKRSKEARKGQRSLDTSMPRGRDAAWTRERITANKVVLYAIIFVLSYTPLLVDWIGGWSHSNSVAGYVLGITIAASVPSQGWLNAMVYLFTELLRRKMKRKQQKNVSEFMKPTDSHSFGSHNTFINGDETFPLISEIAGSPPNRY